MSYQFGHIEGYARSSKKSYSIHDVCKEAERVPGYCDHVKNPMPPTIIHGCTPSEAVEMAETWAEQAKDVSGRKLRIDAPVMLAGVLSYPRDGQHWDLFREQAVGWLRGKYGDRLVSVIEHQDEEHPHLHFYCVPLPGEDFDLLHEGRAASAKVKRDTAAAKGQHHASQMRLAYNTAMKGWQDELHAGVGIYLGLARMGPKRMRLKDRGQWKAYTRALQAIVDAEKVSREAQLDRMLTLQRAESEQLDNIIERQAFLDFKHERLETKAAELAKELAKEKALVEAGKAELAKEKALIEADKAELAKEKALIEADKAELEANPPTSRLKETTALLAEQNRLFKGTIRALAQVLTEPQMQILTKTMQPDQRHLVRAVMEDLGRGHNYS